MPNMEEIGEQEEPLDIPDKDRVLGIVRVDTEPPGMLVRLVGRLIAPAGVDESPWEQVGTSPQTMSVACRRGSGTRFLVQGFPQQLPRPGEVAVLRSMVVGEDGEPREGTIDEVTLYGDGLDKTALVVTVFDEEAPQSPQPPTPRRPMPQPPTQ